MSYSVRRADRRDVSFLTDVELAAAQMLVGYAPESILNETTPIIDFETACAAGLLWVATLNERPVGFAHVKRLEPGSAHLDELDVHPEHARKGLGRQLVHTVCDWSRGAHIPVVTLSTFRDVPWNMPFYASMGFEILPPEEWSTAIAALVADEQRRGLDITRRVIMRRTVR